ncbi:MAG: FKBP-type peptidyl-prolyl cis-trans isomerase [Phaeodactylibacter sp.]|nr:FKBP-type peptidyl-prolyl cis-trans isomerase [Phaeodactylibacter sp.]MCB9302388.1 FKBP-type peptidyl-prolyl cis-trans isomerase [Lewinellaceae bacterium]
MTISNNKVVTLHYKLQEGDATGELVEETFGSDPLVFLYGVGQMIPEFESQLSGKKAGDAFSFGINSEEAYGEYDPDAVVAIPKDTFVVDGKLDETLLQEGKVIPMRDPDGNQLLGTIMEIKEEEVVMDFNHPMAGADLFFTVSIEEVRDATESEIEHGHVHGAGGHHH